MLCTKHIDERAPHYILVDQLLFFMPIKPKPKQSQLIRREAMPRPHPTKDGMLTLKGDDLTEALILASDPKARSKDRLLLSAKRVAKYAKATELSDSQLRGVSWFSHLLIN
jgi:hypothetical protein